MSNNQYSERIIAMLQNHSIEDSCEILHNSMIKLGAMYAKRSDVAKHRKVSGCSSSYKVRDNEKGK